MFFSFIIYNFAFMNCNIGMKLAQVDMSRAHDVHLPECTQPFPAWPGLHAYPPYNFR
jgi:hypothetical protein